MSTYSGLIDEPGGYIEESQYISPYVTELMAWLDDCLQKFEDGRESEILSDPFFESGLSDEKVDELIRVIDEDLKFEIDRYPSYHENRQGCNTAPDYWRLSASGRRALAEGCLAIMRRHGS